MPVRLRAALAVLLVLFLGVAGFLFASGGQALPHAEAPAAVTAVERPAPTVTLAAVGDVMCHLPQVRAAWDAERGVYDFGPAFAEIAPYLGAADVTVANLETVLDDKRPYRGYPRFNSPAALAVALAQAGVDVVTTANNHSLDQGEAGVLATLTNLEAAGLLTTGTFRSEKERAPLLQTVKGFKLAFLAYTTTTNGLPLPPGKEYLVNLWEETKVEADIATARSAGAEFVVVSLHFGQEYQRRPSAEQEEIVQKVVAAGADLVLGSHPHVVQPVAEVTRPGEGGSALIAYSLGNFISNQKDPYTDQGMILYITLERNPLTDKVRLRSHRVFHTRVLRGKEIKVVPAEFTESYLDKTRANC